MNRYGTSTPAALLFLHLTALLLLFTMLTYCRQASTELAAAQKRLRAEPPDAQLLQALQQQQEQQHAAVIAAAVLSQSSAIALSDVTRHAGTVQTVNASIVE
jgi:hypothetical protein